MFKKNQYKKIPGPSVFEFLFNVESTNPITIHSELFKKYGAIVKTAGFNPLCIVSCPKIAGHILQENHENYLKDDIGYKSLARIIGQGILTEYDHNIWWPMRHILNPVFYSKLLLQRIPEITPHIEQTCIEWSKKINTARPIDIHYEMISLTAEVAISLLYGEQYLYLKHDMLRFTKIANIYGTSLSQYFDWLPLPQHFPYRHIKKVFYKQISQMIEHHRKLASPPHNFLTDLIQAIDPQTNAPYAEKRVVDEIITFAITGHETIGNILAWALYAIARNSEIDQNLQDEFNQVLGGRSPTLDDIPKLKYTRMVLDETMRCYPVIWSYGRKALKDDVVNDYFIPAGTNLSISVYNIHHNPIYWEQPGLFYPERFAPEKDRLRERFAFIPFGAGPRICIGSHFALIEAFLILPMILQKYKLQLLSKDPINLKPMIALRPAEKMMMTIKTR